MSELIRHLVRVALFLSLALGIEAAPLPVSVDQR